MSYHPSGSSSFGHSFVKRICVGLHPRSAFSVRRRLVEPGSACGTSRLSSMPRISSRLRAYLFFGPTAYAVSSGL